MKYYRVDLLLFKHIWIFVFSFHRLLYALKVVKSLMIKTVESWARVGLITVSAESHKKMEIIAVWRLFLFTPSKIRIPWSIFTILGAKAMSSFIYLSQESFLFSFSFIISDFNFIKHCVLHRLSMGWTITMSILTNRLYCLC